MCVAVIAADFRWEKHFAEEIFPPGVAGKVKRSAHRLEQLLWRLKEVFQEVECFAKAGLSRPSKLKGRYNRHSCSREGAAADQGVAEIGDEPRRSRGRPVYGINGTQRVRQQVKMMFVHLHERVERTGEDVCAARIDFAQEDGAGRRERARNDDVSTTAETFQVRKLRLKRNNLST